MNQNAFQVKIVVIVITGSPPRVGIPLSRYNVITTKSGGVELYR